MKTIAITFKTNAYGQKRDDVSASHISTINDPEVESMEVDFRRRVVWIKVNDKVSYFTPFESLSQIRGTREEADAELPSNGRGKR